MDDLTKSEATFFESGGETPPETPKEETIVTQEVKPEAGPGDADADGADEKRTVPYRAMKEEREKRKARDRENAELRERLARIEGRLEPKDEKPQEIDPLKKLDTLEQREAQREQQARQQQAMNQLAGIYREHVREYQSEAPDVAEARNFLLQSYVEEWRDLGYDDAQIENMAIAYEADVVHRAHMSGANAAERIYKAAKRRGYKTEEKPDPKNDAKLARVAEGQAKQKSLSGAAGGGSGPLTPQQIADMSDAEFDKITSGDAWGKLFNAA